MEVSHDKECCIGCGACVAVDPGHWKMADDSKSQVINAVLIKKVGATEHFRLAEPGDIEESVSVCPVGCIKLKK